MASSTYLIALGSNRRGRHGGPGDEVRAALAVLDTICTVRAASPIVTSAPLGPSRRRFANAAALVESDAAPPALLARVKAIERDFGRRHGMRWGERVIDLDIVLWSGGAWRGVAWRNDGLTIPHVAYRERGFVLGPALAIAARWRDPSSGRTIRHLAHRLAKVDRTPRRS